MLRTQWVPIFGALVAGVLATSQYYQDHCQNHKAQTGLDLDELMGIWYGIEVFYHRDRIHTTEPRHEEAVCPFIQLSRDSKQEINLIWQEPSRYLEYFFRIHKPSVWIANASSMPPFQGTVRVLKAVSSHMVLTFCSQSNHYSILLAREKYLHYGDIEGVEAMIDRFNLTIYDKSRQCRSSAAIYTSSLYTIIVLAVVSVYRL